MKVPANHIAFCIPCSMPFQGDSSWFKSHNTCPQCGTAITLFKIGRNGTINLSKPVQSK